MDGSAPRRRGTALLITLACAAIWPATRPLSVDAECAFAQACASSGDAERAQQVPPPVWLRPAGGARVATVPSRLLPATLPTAWTAAMSRSDVLIGPVDPDHDDAYSYRLPYADDVSYPVIQGYGAKLSHHGAEQFTLDFGMPVGTPVYAAREGVVVLLEDSHEGGCAREDCGRLANFIVLLHSDGTTGEYFHLERGSAQVRYGEPVRRGQLLALSGNTGFSTAPHLHFGVYRRARDGYTQSLAVRFQTRLGIVSPLRSGARYLNALVR